VLASERSFVEEQEVSEAAVQPSANLSAGAYRLVLEEQVLPGQEVPEMAPEPPVEAALNGGECVPMVVAQEVREMAAEPPVEAALNAGECVAMGLAQELEPTAAGVNVETDEDSATRIAASGSGSPPTIVDEFGSRSTTS
jgi:hypothetical protein